MAKLSTIKIRTLLEQSDSAGVADLKGAKLEELASYLFGKLRGLSLYGQNIFNASKSRELDLVFKNDRRTSDLHFMDAFIPIECKNTKQKTTSDQVNWFANKISDIGVRYGILLTLSGVTGDHDRDAARYEIQRAKIKLGVCIMVLTRAEILSLRSTYDLARLLEAKFDAICIQEKVEFDS